MASEAAVEVALVLYKTGVKGKFVLAVKEVKTISPYLDDSEVLGSPFLLKQNERQKFSGQYCTGKGFYIRTPRSPGADNQKREK